MSDYLVRKLLGCPYFNWGGVAGGFEQKGNLSKCDKENKMYNPFDKEIDDLEFNDLKKLIDKQIKEGFYIEYKSDFQKGNKIAKSIASFANTHGGWYFVGVEDEEDTNIAKDLVGFDIKKNRQPQERIRSIAKEHIHPLPIFYLKLIEFKKDRGILVIFIPESFETPHILSNGVVYRRNGEESSPIKETDRYTLDKLYRKSINFEDRVKSFFVDPFGMTQGESESGIPFIKFYFMPKRFEDIQIKNFYQNDYLNELKDLVDQKECIIKGIKEPTFSIPFQNITRSTNSIIFRSVSNKIEFSNFTFEFFINGAAKIRIPISSFPVTIPLNENDSENKYLKKIYGEIGDELKWFKLVKVYELYLSIRYAIQKYLKYFKKLETYSKIFMTIELVNIYRVIPFVESEFYWDYLKRYHVPACMHEYKRIPDVYNPKPWKEIKIGELEKDDLLIVFTILNGLGMASLKIGEKLFLDDFVPYLKELSKK